MILKIVGELVKLMTPAWHFVIISVKDATQKEEMNVFPVRIITIMQILISLVEKLIKHVNIMSIFILMNLLIVLHVYNVTVYVKNVEDQMIQIVLGAWILRYSIREFVLIVLMRTFMSMICILVKKFVVKDLINQKQSNVMMVI